MISDFISRIQYIHGTGSATEHSYRSAFEKLFQNLGVTALNEPKREECGAPDFIIFKDNVVIGHLEAKDLNTSIHDLSEDNKEQQERYKAALPNLIYSNGLDWDFYREGELTSTVRIADLIMGELEPNPDEYQNLECKLNDFIIQKSQTITNPSNLAKLMAGKANLIKDVLYKTLKNDKNLQTEISDQYKAFKDNLIQDIDLEGFADIYSETIVYGMFGASLNKSEPGRFTRQDAVELIPKTNPFLKSLFSFVAGYELDKRIAWIIDDLASIFESCDMVKIMEGFGTKTGQLDPFVHFYETFLSAYNPTKKKIRGVWYTPEPVVDFIVRAVDKLLQTEFGLTDGLADTSKIKNGGGYCYR